MNSEKDIEQLHFFMTKGLSLRGWEETNIIARELNYFSALLSIYPKIDIHLYTYNTDLQEEHSLLNEFLPSKNITLVPLETHRWWQNLKKIISNVRNSKRKVVRTNQTPGALYPLVMSLFSKNSMFVYRTGYSVSDFKKRENKVIAFIFYRAVEIICGYFCDLRVSSSVDQIERLAFKKKSNICEIPNYIPDYLYDCNHNNRAGFVFYGRLSKQKQIYEICDTFANLPQITLDVYGNGDEELKLKKIFAPYPNIRFLKSVPNHNLAQVMNSYRFGLLLSKYEGMPKVAIEMMAMGLVLIATPVGNLPSILSHEKNAFVAPNDPRGWLEFLSKVSSYQEKELEALSQAAIVTAEKFKVENAIRKEIKAWEKLY